MLIPLRKKDRFGSVIKRVAVTSSALSLQKSKPNCLKKPSQHGKPKTPHTPFATNTENLQRCVWSKISRKQITADLSSYAPIKQNPVPSWGDVKPIAKPNCNHNTPCAIRNVKGEGKNKDRLFFNCSKNKEDSCNYFEWLPEEEEKQKANHRTGFAGYSEWLGEEKPNRRTEIINPIPFKDGFCGTVLF